MADALPIMAESDTDAFDPAAICDLRGESDVKSLVREKVFADLFAKLARAGGPRQTRSIA